MNSALAAWSWLAQKWRVMTGEDRWLFVLTAWFMLAVAALVVTDSAIMLVTKVSLIVALAVLGHAHLASSVARSEQVAMTRVYLEQASGPAVIEYAGAERAFCPLHGWQPVEQHGHQVSAE